MLHVRQNKDEIERSIDPIYLSKDGLLKGATSRIIGAVALINFSYIPCPINRRSAINKVKSSIILTDTCLL